MHHASHDETMLRSRSSRSLIFIYLFFDPLQQLQRLITMQWWMRPSPCCQRADWADAECSTAEPHGSRSRLCKLDGGRRHQLTAEYAIKKEKKKEKEKTSSESIWVSRAELIIAHCTNRINSTAQMIWLNEFEVLWKREHYVLMTTNSSFKFNSKTTPLI